MKRLTLLTLALAVMIATPAVAQVKATTKASSSGPALKLTTKLSHKYLQQNSTQEVFGTIRVQGGDVQTNGDRAPLNLSVVIDRSTSMNGGKFEQAKLAATRLVDLLAPTDRLAIVSYGSDVTTEVESIYATPDNKEILHNAINRIRLSGSTNLSGGYERGVSLLRGFVNSESVNRVILISDGQANAGITDPTQLGLLVGRHLEEGVSLSTMGIGLDYNEDLMTRIAQAGAGNYYFIENESVLAKVFEKEASGLSSTVARKTILTIDLEPGVELLDIQGFAYKTKGNTATVRLSEFFAHQTKDILLRLSVTTSGPGKKNILKSKLRYDDVATNKRLSLRRSLSAEATLDKAKVIATADKKVMKRVQQVRVAETMKDAMTAWEKGDAKKAEKLIKEQRAQNKAAAAAYDFDDDVAFGRVDSELDSLQKTVTKSSSGSKRGKRARKKSKKRAYDIANEASAF